MIEGPQIDDPADHGRASLGQIWGGLMSVRVCSIEVLYDGDALVGRWRISGEAHAIGVASAQGSFSRALGDTLGADEGVARLSVLLDDCGTRIRQQVAGAWDSPQPLF